MTKKRTRNNDVGISVSIRCQECLECVDVKEIVYRGKNHYCKSCIERMNKNDEVEEDGMDKKVSKMQQFLQDEL